MLGLKLNHVSKRGHRANVDLNVIGIHPQCHFTETLQDLMVKFIIYEIIFKDLYASSWRQWVNLNWILVGNPLVNIVGHSAGEIVPQTEWMTVWLPQSLAVTIPMNSWERKFIMRWFYEISIHWKWRVTMMSMAATGSCHNDKLQCH